MTGDFELIVPAKEGGVWMTEMDVVEYTVLVDGINGFCDQWVASGKRCGDGCPCDGNDRCLLSTIKGFLQEHLQEA
jgi:hypothetical protein